MAESFASMRSCAADSCGVSPRSAIGLLFLSARLGYPLVSRSEDFLQNAAPQRLPRRTARPRAPLGADEHRGLRPLSVRPLSHCACLLATSVAGHGASQTG